MKLPQTKECQSQKETTEKRQKDVNEVHLHLHWTFVIIIKQPVNVFSFHLLKFFCIVLTHTHTNENAKVTP